MKYCNYKKEIKNKKGAVVNTISVISNDPIVQELLDNVENKNISSKGFCSILNKSYPEIFCMPYKAYFNRYKSKLKRDASELCYSLTYNVVSLDGYNHLMALKSAYLGSLCIDELDSYVNQYICLSDAIEDVGEAIFLGLDNHITDLRDANNNYSYTAINTIAYEEKC